MFDTELFINLVESHPAIWDSNKDIYNNKTEKTKSWDQICQALFRDYAENTQAEKNEIASQLKRRWKSLRDSYTREVSRIKKAEGTSKNGDNGTTYGRRQYVFFNNLKFLHTVVSVNRSLFNAAEDTGGGSQEGSIGAETDIGGTSNLIGDIWQPHEIPQEAIGSDLWQPTEETANCSEITSLWESPKPIQLPTSGFGIKRKKEESCSESQLYDLLNRSVQLRLKRETTDENDSDRLFMLSLVSELRQIPDHMKLDAKMELMNVFKKFKFLTKPNSTSLSESDCIVEYTIPNDAAADTECDDSNHFVDSPQPSISEFTNVNSKHDFGNP